MLSITCDFHFDSAHRLFRKDLSETANRDIYGGCTDLHGHSYRLQVCVCGHTDANGWILDFSELKAVVSREVLDRYDHACLNDLPDYQECPPTAENIARTIFFKLRPHLKRPNCRLHRVTVFETRDTQAEWTENHADDL
jgi:6-pyruvoyltetrahydropterin/6-carboxytetrahydropterin synthase